MTGTKYQVFNPWKDFLPRQGVGVLGSLLGTSDDKSRTVLTHIVNL